MCKYLKMDNLKNEVKRMNELQIEMANEKIREKLQMDYSRRSGGADKRVGIKSPGDASWTTRHNQMMQQ